MFFHSRTCSLLLLRSRGSTLEIVPAGTPARPPPHTDKAIRENMYLHTYIHIYIYMIPERGPQTVVFECASARQFYVLQTVWEASLGTGPGRRQVSYLGLGGFSGLGGWGPTLGTGS